jgi:undecaprenyl-diphosphatase
MATLALFVLLAGALLLFLKLGSEVMEGETFAFDRAIKLALRGGGDPDALPGPGWLRQAMLDVTALGGEAVLTLMTVIIAGYLLTIRKRATAAFLVGAVAGGAVVGTLLKLLFDRPRPDIVHHLVDVYNASFPSGHAMNSAVVYLTLGALLARTEKSRGPRIYIVIVALLLTLSIGVSRVYLGVHWPSDVVAGWCVGGAWAMLCSLVARRLQRKRAIEPAAQPPSLPK